MTYRLSPRVALAVLILSGLSSPSASAQPQTATAITHPFAPHVTEASRRFGLPEAWIWAVMRIESGGDPRAVSRTGAMGAMQVMPATWTALRAQLGLADETDPGRWQLREDAEPILRELGRRGDIIKRMHEALADCGIERATASYRIDATPDAAIVGRLVDRGLHDELAGTAYAIVDGIDGRTHHVELPDLDAAGDGRPGAIVAVRSFEDRKGRQRIALAVRSDLDLSAQVAATGATWLDRQNFDRSDDRLGGGFGSEVRDAMVARVDHLAAEGLARRQGQRVMFASDLLDTLRKRELDEVSGRLSAETGLPHAPCQAGEHVSGVVKRRVDLASGRFAMVDSGMGFALVPWSPSLDREMGKHIAGVARGDGGVDWSLGRSKGIGL